MLDLRSVKLDKSVALGNVGLERLFGQNVQTLLSHSFYGLGCNLLDDRNNFSYETSNRY